MNKNPEILAIKSDKQELKRVEQFLSRIFEENQLPQKCFNKVLLCISEAVINSIEHGNKNDSRKKVDIEINCMEGNISIVVHDEGEGFDYTQVDDPTLRNNIKKEAGRGIHIIKSLCSHVEFRNEGKSVKINIDLK